MVLELVACARHGLYGTPLDKRRDAPSPENWELIEQGRVQMHRLALEFREILRQYQPSEVMVAWSTFLAAKRSALIIAEMLGVEKTEVIEVRVLEDVLAWLGTITGKRALIVVTQESLATLLPAALGRLKGFCVVAQSLFYGQANLVDLKSGECQLVKGK